MSKVKYVALVVEDDTIQVKRWTWTRKKLALVIIPLVLAAIATTLLVVLLPRPIDEPSTFWPTDGSQYKIRAVDSTPPRYLCVTGTGRPSTTPSFYDKDPKTSWIFSLMSSDKHIYMIVNLFTITAFAASNATTSTAMMKPIDVDDPWQWWLLSYNGTLSTIKNAVTDAYLTYDNSKLKMSYSASLWEVK